MTDNRCPPPREVQDFLFKQASIGQICEEFPGIPASCSLIAADAKRGLLYIGHENKLIVSKPGTDSNPEWKFELDLPDKISRVTLSCDYSFLAVTFSGASAIIYDASSIHKHKLDILHEIRLSTSGGRIIVSDLKWNPAIPEMLCSITSDHTIGCFQVSRDKKAGVQILGMERPQNFEALCVSWSPKGKQLVIGCKSGDIIQLKPELKMARHLSGPNPNEGIIISILWISNYQFCTCFFHPIEQRVSVMIVDAPKGVTVPKFTNYEDITFGSGSMESLCYFFEYIQEWGIIIAASSHSSEVAVLGTSDNGTTWNLWQLSDGSSGQLPLNRKKKTENYPVGMALDKSSIQKLPWGETTLPNPVPVLRILVTSGQLCCYHLIYLRDNVPILCTPPTETVAAPQMPRPSLGPTEVSFNLPTGATSTPRSKQTVLEAPFDKPKLPTNMFGETAGSTFSFLPPENKGPSEPVPPSEMKSTGFPAPTEIKPGGLFGQGDGKTSLFSQNKPFFTQQPDQQPSVEQQPSVIQQPNDVQQPSVVQESSAVHQPDTKSSGLLLKFDNILNIPVPPQKEIQQMKEPTEEFAQQHLDEQKQVIKETVYDDAICLDAYYEEQARFEKELKSKLEPPSWNCGTEEERQLIVEKTEEIDQFLRQLKETTDSLANDVVYLKALLLQSFAWLEETKSKNSAHTSLTGRNRSDGRLAELQRLFNYTQSQLIQATKVLDLEWAEHNHREISRMKLPNMEVIYQSLIRYNQIVLQEKRTMEELSKKWRAIGRNTSIKDTSLTSLDRSLANLNLSQTGMVNDSAIDLRCKLIASNTRNFSQKKQSKLRDLLSETAPRIIKTARPTAIQDRLEATLSSLASLKTSEIAAAKANKTALEQQQRMDAAKAAADAKAKAAQNPLSSLDNMLSDLQSSGLPPLSKSISSTTPFPSFGTKLPTSPATNAQATSKENVPVSFAQSASSNQPTSNKGFAKMDSIGFGSVQKSLDSQQSRDLLKSPIESAASKFTFPTFGKLGSPPETVPAQQVSSTMPNITVPKLAFSFAMPPTSPQDFSVLKPDFKFSSKPNPQPQTQPTTTGALDFTSLSTRPGLTITPTAEPAKTTATTAPTLSAALSFGKPAASAASPPQQTSMFGQSASQGTGMQSLFGKSGGPLPALSKPSPPATTESTTPQATATTAFSSASTATTTAAPTGSLFGTPTMMGSLSITPSFSVTASTSQASTTEVSAAATTTTSSSLFGNVASTAPSSTTSFSGLLGATASLNFGSGTTSASITPAFGKTTNAFSNVFGGTSASPATSNIIGAKSDAVSSTTTTFGKVVTTTATASTTTATTTTASSIFGSVATNATSPSMFGGQTAALSSSSTENSFFKVPASTAASTAAPTAAPTASIFGGTASSAPSGSVFGSTIIAKSVFGAKNATTQQSSVFGTTTSTTQSGGTSIFGGAGTSSTFGSANSTIASPMFGATTAATTTTASSSIFGTPSSGSIFGRASTTPATGSAFGASATPTSSIFGSAASEATTTATPATSSIFGSTAANQQAATGNIFGSTATSSAATGNIFGSPATSSAATGNIFGSTATSSAATGNIFGSTATSSAATGNIFGASAASPPAQASSGNVFGGTSPSAAPAGGSIFGGQSALGSGTSMFGGTTSPPGGPMFGQSSAFGTKSVFGSPASEFGAKPAFATGFGTQPAFGSTPTAGFGSSPVLGTGSPLGNTSPGKVFGSSTFEALGSAPTGGELSFGSLAQKTPEQNKNQTSDFQGPSSFSSWR